MSEVLEKAKSLCEKGGHRLLYLSKHGSHLYGTNTPTSDTDFKGVFAPNPYLLLMGKKINTLDYQTKEDGAAKNTKDDTDLQLFSIQFWLNKLVKKGETEGIELLYSITNRNAVLYCDPFMEEVFLNVKPLYDPKNVSGFLGFAIGQARTYFTKAERFNVIKSVYDYVSKIATSISLLNDKTLMERPLSTIFDNIIESFYHQSYCTETESNGIRSLILCGKVHQETITIVEFFGRLKREYQKYGHRTRTAADMDNKDWKSLSHALKAIIEVRTILTELRLDFPLPEKHTTILRNIKLGKVEYEEVERLILTGIDEVDTLISQFSDRGWGYNYTHVEGLIRKLYGM